MWTMKEAYTKALGLGLGFDFRRVEYDIESNVVRVDKTIPPGWRFSKFVLNDSEDLYEGVVAEFIGGTQTDVIEVSESPKWLLSQRAEEFVKRVIRDLQSESEGQ